MKDTDIAWAAGLFEGEGCFKKSRHTPTLSLAMTDRDVVERFGKVVVVGTLLGPYRSTNGIKPVWRWDIHGLWEYESILRLFWPYLGARRRDKASEILEWAHARRGKDWARGMKPVSRGETRS